MPEDILAQHLLLPEMKLLGVRKVALGVDLVVEMTSRMEVCPKCATPSRSVYDRRWVLIKDEPLRKNQVRFRICKRRFSCSKCKLPFTEPIGGVVKGKRTTDRLARAVQKACEQYVDLKRVRSHFRVSGGYVYAAPYRHLERKQREKRSDWPERVGIDEHFFKRGRALRGGVS